MDTSDNHSPKSRPLWSRHRRGDPDALGELLTQRDRKWIQRLARSLLGQRLRAEVDSGDVVQTALTRILAGARRHAFDWVQDRRSLNRLLATKVEQTIRNEARARNAVKRGGADAVRVDGDVERLAMSKEPAPLESLVTHESADFLALARSALSSRDRRLLKLRLDEGLGYDEIGEILGMSAESARRAKNRAVKRLAEIIRRLERGAP